MAAGRHSAAGALGKNTLGPLPSSPNTPVNVDLFLPPALEVYPSVSERIASPCTSHPRREMATIIQY